MTLLNVKVIPNARTEKIIEEEGRLKVHLKAPAVEGKANKALIDFLSDHLNKKKSRIRIIRGLTSREKTVEVLD